MITVRPLHWPADRAALIALDTSFVTDRVYRVAQAGRSFALQVALVTPPLRKDYAFAIEIETLPTFDCMLVAELDTSLVGVAALRFEEWNRRAILHHCYIAPGARGRGVGRALIDEVIAAAKAQQARCVWLETQNMNYGAIIFYERLGFQWCGLDTSLYDPASTPAQETALFFIRHLA